VAAAAEDRAMALDSVRIIERDVLAAHGDAAHVQVA
jgi:hypothetical protein